MMSFLTYITGFFRGTIKKMGHSLFGGLKNIGSDYLKINCYVEIIH
jgi:hypothetical protein